MNIQSLIQKWFQCWNDGDFLNIPVSNNFKHTSPFGTIYGKEAYLQLVEDNRDRFLGYQFQIHDGIYQENIACVRYTGTQGDFSLDVTAITSTPTQAPVFPTPSPTQTPTEFTSGGVSGTFVNGAGLGVIAMLVIALHVL